MATKYKSYDNSGYDGARFSNNELSGDVGIVLKGEKNRVCVGIAIFFFFVSLGLATVLVLASLDVIHLNKNNSTSNGASNQSGRIDDICLTPQCLQVSLELRSKMNASVDPCENFWEYACGTMLKTNPKQRTFSIAISTVQNAMASLLGRPKSKNNTAVDKAKQFYASCMDILQIEKDQQNTTEKLRQRLIGLGSNFAEWLKFVNFEVPTKGPAFGVPGVSSLFRLSVGKDIYNPIRNVLYVSQAGLGLGDPRMYNLSIETYNESRTNYMKSLKALEDENKLPNFSNNVWEFEEELATISLPKNDPNISDEAVANKLMPFDNLTAMYDAIPWEDLLKNMVPNLMNQANKTEVIVSPLHYFEGLNDLIKDTLANNPQKIFHYFVARVLLTYKSYFTVTTKSISQTVIARSSVCAASTTAHYPMVAGSMYAGTMDKNMNKDVEEMILKTKEVFIERLKDNGWMSDETKKASEEKANKMGLFVGYPEEILNNTLLDEMYETYEAGTNYYDNVISATVAMIKHSYSTLDEPQSRERWLENISPAVINAFYSPTNNAIYIIAGIMVPPFYRYGEPRYTSLGRMGAIIGHEITHGFDNNGAEFGPTGKLQDWWSKPSKKDFNERVKCVVDQYNQYKIYGLSVDGKLTSGENIADIGGLIEAYYVYQKYVKQAANEEERKQLTRKLPGFPGTNEQALFTAFGQNWCGTRTKAELEKLLLVDPHSPGKFRVVGTVRNIKEFSEVFKCKLGTPYNPTDPNERCEIW